MKTKIIQITSGRGPVECCRVVKEVLDIMLESCQQLKFDIKMINEIQGPRKGTLFSAAFLISRATIDAFIAEWKGTIQWISYSPYRKNHQRKNWFIGIEVYDLEHFPEWKEQDIQFQTQRASGAGGQHINTTESSVRAIHIPTGLSVVCADQRSQHQNKKQAVERLKQRYLECQLEQAMKAQQQQWNQHNALERGNPIKAFERKLL